ncbi:MAG: K(+)-transporting ATPase subunit F [Gammaproteobacteria bacterium]|nr:K(+)-transporting ATPase subunit F [Gammaproteobacteria bacterium]
MNSMDRWCALLALALAAYLIHVLLRAEKF